MKDGVKVIIAEHIANGLHMGRKIKPIKEDENVFSSSSQCDATREGGVCGAD